VRESSVSHRAVTLYRVDVTVVLLIMSRTVNNPGCPRNSLAQSVLAFVIPAEAGIQAFLCVFLDSGLSCALARSTGMTWNCVSELTGHKY
jgi:hypothetical protein